MSTLHDSPHHSETPFLVLLMYPNQRIPPTTPCSDLSQQKTLNTRLSLTKSDVSSTATRKTNLCETSPDECSLAAIRIMTLNVSSSNSFILCDLWLHRWSRPAWTKFAPLDGTKTRAQWPYSHSWLFYCTFWSPFSSHAVASLLVLLFNFLGTVLRNRHPLCCFRNVEPMLPFPTLRFSFSCPH